MRKLLREFVRAVLDEAAVSPGAAASAGLALVKSVSSDDGMREYMLYDPKFYLEIIDDLLQGGEFADADEAAEELISTMKVTKGYMGYISAFPPVGTDGPCWDAYQIGQVVAEQGYGPLLYDIVMSDVGKLTSDRQMVRSDAAKIWKHYRDQRSDVKKVPFDDVASPKTPPTEDDCVLHDRDPELNFAYSMKGNVGTSALEKNHRKFLKDLTLLGKKFGIKFDPNELVASLFVGGDKHFQVRYAETSPFLKSLSFTDDGKE